MTKIIKAKVRIARRLRARQTPSEAKMWALVRSKRLQNYKFYRQFPIEPFITDFCCRARKLVVEIDGGGHTLPGKVKYDRKRDEYLQKQGYRVIHVWSSEIMNNIEGVIEAILAALKN